MLSRVQKQARRKGIMQARARRYHLRRLPPNPFEKSEREAIVGQGDRAAKRDPGSRLVHVHCILVLGVGYLQVPLHSEQTEELVERGRSSQQIHP